MQLINTVELYAIEGFTDVGPVQLKELQRWNTRVCMQDSSNRVAHKYRRKNAPEKTSCPDNENDAAAY
jgi:hypothetical protein